MGQIKVLDQNMINMIAAGEVIERPASVVKELMENSIDAGAKKITVTIEDGGRKLISVSDDGAGMDAEDLTRAFEPHATSKIKTADDLHKISTLGFRGEALASIASVALVKAVSRTKDSPGGNVIEIDCGNRKTVGPCSADYGTTIEVRDIFYKLPARRKFLKTANTEMGHITEVFTRIALANGTIDMVLIHNTRELYRLSGKDGIRRRIAELFSTEIADSLIETQSNEKGMKIFAILGNPDIAKTDNKFQYVFLNGRFIRDKFISHALKEAYHGSLEANRYGVVFLFIEMPFEEFDVNVHPTKIEVRFYNANLVHSQILSCLREKLLGTNLDVAVKMPAQNQNSQQIREAMAEFFKKHQPAAPQQHFGFRSAPSSGKFSPPAERPTQFVMPSVANDKRYLQIHESFIVAETNDGFVIIDQHALHERIMYEDLKRRVAAGKLESQRLLIPESLEVNEREADAIKDNAELMDKLGIQVEPFGPRTYAINSFPMLLSKASLTEFMRDLANLLTDKEISIDAERLLDEVLHLAACKAAIKAGQKLNDKEIEQLLADKQYTEYSSRCPHGRPTTIKFSIAELEKQFKRT